MDFFNKLFSPKRNKIFGGFEENSGDYRILIRNIREVDSKSNYFLDDTSIINRLPAKWRFPYADFICRGGYDYSISVFRGDELETLLLVCFLCNTISIQGGDKKLGERCFKVTERTFQSLLKHDFTPIEILTREFNSKEEAMLFWNEEQKNPKLIKQHQLLADWMRFEGEYTLDFEIDTSLGDIKASDYLDKELKVLGDCGEYEHAQMMAAGSHKFTFYIKSSKNLFDKIDEAYPKMLQKNQTGNSAGFFSQDWESFNDYSLELYYKT